MKLSHLSETLIGSEIVKLGGEIREKIRQGERIYNFTVGDFDPSEGNGINPDFKNSVLQVGVSLALGK